MAVCEGDSQFKFLYDLEQPIEKKIEIICKEIYGADGIELSETAQKQIETYTRQGYGGLPSTFRQLTSKTAKQRLTMMSQSAWPRRSTRSRTTRS